jgi:hypothetical protein
MNGTTLMEKQLVMRLKSASIPAEFFHMSVPPKTCLLSFMSFMTCALLERG